MDSTPNVSATQAFRKLLRPEASAYGSEEILLATPSAYDYCPMLRFQNLKRSILEFRQMPRVSIDLMVAATLENDAFFSKIVRKHYNDALRRHPRYLIIPQMVYGVALTELPRAFDDYYMTIEASARRNYKKAQREGCSFRRIDFNAHLSEIAEIKSSAEMRQGRPMPASYRNGVMKRCENPRSLCSLHDYPYFGVFHEGRLIGYAGCLIAGQYCNIEHILGHASYLPLGVVPQLILGIAQYVLEHHGQVRYFSYGMYFGAGESMRRFKRKFRFVPHRVDWVLGEDSLPSRREVA